MNKRIWIIIVVIVVVAPFVLGLTGLLTWIKFACRFDLVDINSGKIKSEYWYYYIKYHETNSESIMSNVIPPATGIPIWKNVNCFTPGRNNSPHYYFHGAIHQLYEISMLKQLYDLDDKKLIGICGDVRDLWIKDNNYHSADKYLRELHKEYTKSGK